MDSSNSHSYSTFRALILAAFASLVVLWLRWDGGDVAYFINNSLWAEDGVVFINEAERYGLRSLWNPYAGYLHLYPRLFAALAAQFDLVYTPWIFMFGFILAVWVMMFVIVRGMMELKISLIGVLVAAILVGVQPNNGHIFFTLTNAQWFFGVALCVLVSVPKLYSKSYWNAFGAVMISLTGPFSVLLLPVMLLRLYLDREYKNYQLTKRFAFPLAMLVCATIQIFFIISSGRGAEELSVNGREWLVTLFDSITFGGREALVIILSFAFWGVLLYSLLFSWRHLSNEFGKKVLTTILLLLAAGFCMYLGALWAFKHGPGGLNPVWGNARYFFSPYAMILLSTLVVSVLTPRISILAISLFAIISLLQFRSVTRPDLQFPAFAAFTKVKADVVIPIAPKTSDYPGWHIALRKNELEKLFHEIHSFTGDEIDQFVDFDRSRLALDIQDICGRSPYIGLAVELWKREAGDVQIIWDSGATSLTRFYPAGQVELQYALANSGKVFPLVVEVGAAVQDQDFQKIEIYCLGAGS